MSKAKTNFLINTRMLQEANIFPFVIRQWNAAYGDRSVYLIDVLGLTHLSVSDKLHIFEQLGPASVRKAFISSISRSKARKNLSLVTAAFQQANEAYEATGDLQGYYLIRNQQLQLLTELAIRANTLVSSKEPA